MCSDVIHVRTTLLLPVSGLVIKAVDLNHYLLYKPVAASSLSAYVTYAFGAYSLQSEGTGSRFFNGKSGQLGGYSIAMSVLFWH